MSGHASLLQRQDKRQKREARETLPIQHSAIRRPNSPYRTANTTTVTAASQGSATAFQANRDRQGFEQMATQPDLSQMPLMMAEAIPQPIAQLMANRRGAVLQAFDMTPLDPEGYIPEDEEEEEEDDDTEIIYDENASLIEQDQKEKASITQRIKKWFLALWEKMKGLKDIILGFAKRALKIKKYGKNLVKKAERIANEAWGWGNEILGWASIVEPSQILKTITSVSKVLQKFFEYGTYFKAAYQDKELWSQTELLLGDDGKEKQKIWDKVKGYANKAKDAVKDYVESQANPKTNLDKSKAYRKRVQLAQSALEKFEKLDFVFAFV